jgi:hypothetical protein
VPFAFVVTATLSHVALRGTALTFSDQVARATVAVHSDGQHRGSGFFVQPDLVTTCAHVLSGHPDEVEVRYERETLPARVVLRVPPEEGTGPLYAFPDLCFIRLNEPLDHPFVSLADTPELPDRLKVVAQARSLASAEPAEATLLLDVVGRAGQYVRVKGDEITSGMSGAPAFDPRTGLVHGVVKASQDRKAPRGGLFVPATYVALALTENAEVLQSRATHRRPLSIPAGSPVRELIVAQDRASDRLAYRIVDDPSLTQSTVYVRQRLSRYAIVRSSAEPLAVLQTVEAAVSAHRHVLLTGAAGAGKTTLLGYVARRTAEWWLDPDPVQRPPFGPVVAVRLPARTLGAGQPLQQAIAASLSRELALRLDGGVAPDLFTGPPVAGADWLLMIDGLDEILDLQHRLFLLDALGERIGEYGERFRFLVATRPLGDDEMARLRRRVPAHEAERLGEYELAPFDREALTEFAYRWFTARSPGDTAARAKAFLHAVVDTRLRPLIETPLLATIAAVVYERHPGSRFPLDRTGLYEKFVAHLLHDKRGELELGETLRSGLAKHSGQAARLADVLVDEIEACLEQLGHDAVVDRTDPSAGAVLGWLRRHVAAVPDVPKLEQTLRNVLITTGVIQQVGPDLQFRHQSLAEYFAAGRLARAGFSAERWTAAARVDGLTSLAAFTLARRVREKLDVAPVLRRLRRPGALRRYPNLDLLGEVLRDGMTFGATDAELAEAVLSCVRHRLVIGEKDAQALFELLARTLVRTGQADALLAVATDRSASVVKCVESARVLLLHGPVGLRPAALDALETAAGRPREPVEDRLWAYTALAEYGDDERAGRALRRIFRIATGRDLSAPRHRALAILFALDGRGAALGFLARAADPGLDRQQRMEALDLLVMALDAMSWRYLGTPAGGVAYLRQHRPLADVGDVAGVLHLVLGDHETGLHERLAAAFVLAWPLGPELVESLAHAVMRDPTFGWATRLHVAIDLARWDLGDPAVRLMSSLACDDLLPEVNRVATVAVLAGYAPDVADEHLSRLLAGLGSAPSLRYLAWLWLARRDRVAADYLADQWVADAATPFSLRLRVAVARARQDGTDPDPGAAAPSRRDRAVARFATIVLRVERTIARPARRLDRGLTALLNGVLPGT